MITSCLLQQVACKERRTKNKHTCRNLNQNSHGRKLLLHAHGQQAACGAKSGAPSNSETNVVPRIKCNLSPLSFVLGLSQSSPACGESSDCSVLWCLG